MKQFSVHPIISNGRENAAIVYMRYRKTLSINHIAEVLHRSTRSIWATCTAAEETLGRRVNNREKPVHIRKVRALQFHRKLTQYRIQAKLFLDHWVETLEDAFNTRSVPLSLLRALQGKNSSEHNEADEPP